MWCERAKLNSPYSIVPTGSNVINVIGAFSGAIVDPMAAVRQLLIFFQYILITVVEVIRQMVSVISP